MEEDHLKDRDVEGDNIKNNIEKWKGGMEWIDLAQDKDRWQAL